MKRIVCLFLVLICVLFVSCGKEKSKVDTVIISNVLEEIEPLEFFSWSSSYENGQWYSADGYGARLPEDISSVPVITYNEWITIDLPDKAERRGVSVYNMSFDKAVYTGEDMMILDEVPKGEWYVSISVRYIGKYILFENEHEASGYQYLFKLIVE
ncbi:MAG: hypothetical protein E7634_08560 [Ruminococcaceae bacterium]|nr:hypothetical protein [Oscillospiraceae bacterium]